MKSPVIPSPALQTWIPSNNIHYIIELWKCESNNEICTTQLPIIQKNRQIKANVRKDVLSKQYLCTFDEKANECDHCEISMESFQNIWKQKFHKIQFFYSEFASQLPKLQIY